MITQQQKQEGLYCPKCGKKWDGKKCSNCGYPQKGKLNG
jgi:ribosomal protein L37E